MVKAGRSKEARMAMMAMTTSSSIKVKALRKAGPERRQERRESMGWIFILDARCFIRRLSELNLPVRRPAGKCAFRGTGAGRGRVERVERGGAGGKGAGPA